MFYYSTNKSLKTVYKIRQERQAKIDYIEKEWKKMDKVVSQNWEQLIHNAILLEGQTAHLGFNIQIVEADYWAPDRVWIYFNTPKGIVDIEFHEKQLLKKIKGVKWDCIGGILQFTNEMSFAKRALEILL